MERKIVCGGECSCLVPLFFALNDRKDRQTELRIAAPWKSTTSIKQQKKEERLHSKRSPCKNCDGKMFATKCRQKHVCGGIALLAMHNNFQRLTQVRVQRLCGHSTGFRQNSAGKCPTPCPGRFLLSVQWRCPLSRNVLAWAYVSKHEESEYCN